MHIHVYVHTYMHTLIVVNFKMQKHVENTANNFTSLHRHLIIPHHRKKKGDQEKRWQSFKQNYRIRHKK